MIDTHSHLDFEQFDDDREEAIQRAFDGGIKKIINVGCNLERSKASIELAEKYENIYATAGMHPSEIFNLRSSIFKILEELRKMAKHSKVVAIGEIGLDYFHLDSDDRDIRDISDSKIEQLKTKQKELFVAQLQLANELHLPVIIHCRDAYEDLLEICKNYRGKTPLNPPFANGGGMCGVIHCFCGDRWQAKQFLDLGFYISFTGNITYSKKEDAEIFEVIRKIPLDRILIETDCPFLAPAPMRGKRNEPLFVKYIAEKIAEIKKIDIAEVEKITDENAKKLFNFGN